jgi:uncharacterized protein YjiS (DUF1127 family)
MDTVRFPSMRLANMADSIASLRAGPDRSRTVEYRGSDYRLMVDRHGGVQIIRRGDGATTYLRPGDDAGDVVKRLELCAGPDRVIEVDMISSDYDQSLWVGNPHTTHIDGDRAMLPGSLEAARRVRLAPPRAKSEHATVFLRALCRVPHIIRRWFMRVESRRELAMLSDYELRDIGLTRNDVDREFMKPFWRD